MSNYVSPYRRRVGRAPSPPTWLWYEQIPVGDDSSSDSAGASDISDDDDTGEFESCSEDDEDYGTMNGRSAGAASDGAHREPEHSDASTHEHERDSVSSVSSPSYASDAATRPQSPLQPQVQRSGNPATPGADAPSQQHAADSDAPKKDVKGKQRAVAPEAAECPNKRREHKKRNREPVLNLRPILTIQKSQGFVWNQDLFVPPYIKDRYIASTSPPNGSGFLSTSAPSLNSINDYEVDVVEIRVEEGEFADIIP